MKTINNEYRCRLCGKPFVRRGITEPRCPDCCEADDKLSWLAVAQRFGGVLHGLGLVGHVPSASLFKSA